MNGGTANTDKQEAAKIVVGLSSQLISASLTFIAINGGIVTFVLTGKEPTFLFYCLFILSLISFVASIVFGGLGIDFVKKKAIAGTWDTKASDTKNWFDYQTRAIFLGILLLIFFPFTGRKESKTEVDTKKVIELIDKTTALNINLIELQKKDSLSQYKISELQKEIEELTNKVIEIKKGN